MRHGERGVSLTPSCMHLTPGLVLCLSHLKTATPLRQQRAGGQESPPFSHPYYLVAGTSNSYTQGLSELEVQKHRGPGCGTAKTSNQYQPWQPCSPFHSPRLALLDENLNPSRTCLQPSNPRDGPASSPSYSASCSSFPLMCTGNGGSGGLGAWVAITVWETILDGVLPGPALADADIWGMNLQKRYFSFCLITPLLPASQIK